MGKRKTEDLLADTPKQPTITVSTEMNSAHPFQAQHYYPGDSVNEHKNLEEANLLINQGKIGQQKENN